MATDEPTPAHDILAKTTGVYAKAREILDRIHPGPWWWGGNTDHQGDIVLRGYKSGYGHIDLMRTAREFRTEEQLAAEWDADSDLRACVERDDYIADELDSPRLYLSFIDLEDMTLNPGRDRVIYEVARDQGLPDDTPRSDRRVYRADVIGVRDPHAEFIAAAPKLVAGLLDLIDDYRMGAENAGRLLQIADEQHESLAAAIARVVAVARRWHREAAAEGAETSPAADEIFTALVGTNLTTTEAG